MSDEHKLEAQLRERGGKGAARELRRNNMVPAVIYGDKKDPLSIALPAKELTKQIHAGGFMTNIMEITADGTKHKVLPKDYQMHPVKDTVMHVDLLRVSNRTIVTVDIPVHFLNEEDCPGLKEGGNLNVVRHTVEVDCRADAIPEHFEVDLAGLQIDDVVHASALKLPDGVKLTIDDRDFTIATIQPTRAEEEETDEVTETEVINQHADTVMGDEPGDAEVVGGSVDD